MNQNKSTLDINITNAGTLCDLHTGAGGVAGGGAGGGAGARQVEAKDPWVGHQEKEACQEEAGGRHCSYFRCFV